MRVFGGKVADVAGRLVVAAGGFVVACLVVGVPMYFILWLLTCGWCTEVTR